MATIEELKAAALKRGQQFAKLYQKGMSIREIAAQSGFSYGCVHRNLALVGTKMRSRGSQPGNNNRMKGKKYSG